MKFKKLIIPQLVALLVTVFLFATQMSANNSFSQQKKNPPPTGEKIIDDPDIPPLYTGGTSEMHRFISNTLRYPADAASRNAQGLVVYTFIVEKDGTLSNFELMHRADSLLNDEALRILQLMPPWRPAKFKNEFVRSKTYVPMYFRLNKGTTIANNTAKPKTILPTAPKPQNPTALQQTDSTAATQPVTEQVETEVFSIVSKMPQYYNGERGLAEFISNQIRYPIEARQQGIEGRIICSFIVGIDGSVSNIEVIQGLHPQLDNEAVRILSLMPKWIPGENNGEKVNVKCLQPIDFSIGEDPIPPLSEE